MNYGASKILLLTLLITACSASPPDAGEATGQRLLVPTQAVEMSGAEDKGTTMNELKAFVEGGAVILASQRGDLDGDGIQDVVLVLDHPGSGEDQLGEGAHRSLLLLLRNNAGQLRQAGRNDTIVPCAKCGGMAGDPFSYVRVEKGAFTVVVEGGSRERWFDEYAFAYSAEERGWLLEQAIHGVTDTITGEAKQTELTREDFGVIRFDEFDPSKLPSVEGA